jgi:hypothetical protein
MLKKIGVVFLLAFICTFAINAQNNGGVTEENSVVSNPDSIKEEQIPESDSISFPENVLADIDFPANDIYDNWKTNQVRYKNTDTVLNHADSLFSFDTTYIKLLYHDSAKYFHPFQGRVTCRFAGGRYRFHAGIDVDLNTGDTVLCAFDGMVRYTAYYRGYGRIVVVRHYNGLETVYAHLSKILVDSNQYIKAGEIIGLGGNTGRSTGSHLHFETRYLGEPLDPESFIDFDKFTLTKDTLMLCKKNFGYLVELEADKNAKYHYIRKGETLSHLSRRYGTSVSRLCYLNGLSRTSILQIGQKIRIR